MARKILLAVDLQHDFIHGSLPVPESELVIPEIDKVKKDFDLVYFTLDWHPLNHCSFKEQGGPWPVHCVHHTAGAALHPDALAGLEEERVRFILKGCVQGPEEYGAFVGFDPQNQDLFEPGDEVVVCGIAAEYCVLETLKNLYAISLEIGFTVKVYLEGTARFESTATVEAFMAENGIERY
jgi:nicotinamidase/pyrazinamidase